MQVINLTHSKADLKKFWGREDVKLTLLDKYYLHNAMSSALSEIELFNLKQSTIKGLCKNQSLTSKVS